MKVAARAGLKPEDLADVDPQTAARRQFAARIWNLMVSKGWTQAEFARRAGLGRDVINSYVNAVSLPTPESAKKLAQALGVTINRLYPGAEEDFSATGTGVTPFEMKTTTEGRMMVRMNLEMPFAAAGEIFAVLEKHGVTTAG